MKGTFDKIKEKLGFWEENEEFPEEFSDEYVEIGIDKSDKKRSKILVRPYIVQDFADIKDTLDALREGYTIALVNIKPLKDKDLIELKRVVNKLKKTCEAIDGDIAGFGEDWLVVTPSFAQIYRSKMTGNIEEE